MKTHLFVSISSIGIASLVLTGCCTSKECQLQQVAKDWCLTIRASQIIPVYPLTEDVLPGDVFLASRPIQDEQAEYEQNGFLPLAQLIVRLHPGGLEDFYLGSHDTKGKTDPPYFWRFDGANLETNKQWLMPRAAFPAYTFSTRHGAGLNVAVPIQGIPVAMNLVGSSQVDGTVLLKDAYTYGFDQVNLQNQLLNWAAANTDMLKQFAPAKDSTSPYYLRMVSRVYLVGAANVSVYSAASYAGSVSGGADKPVNLPMSGTNNVENYTNTLAVLSSALSTALNAPGGTLKVAAASSHSVSLDETFPRPLIVGYLGFDFQILPNGTLSLPRATIHRLNRKSGARVPPATRLVPAYTFGADANSDVLRNWLNADPAHVQTANAWLDKNYHAPNLANVVNAGEFRDVRKRLVDQLIKGTDNKPSP